MRPTPRSVLLLLLLLAVDARADEGLWTLDRFPVARAEAATGVRVDRAWLDRVAATSVRFSNGCSGALVSGAGLAASNEHCLIGCLQALSTPGHDAVADGFLALRPEEERACPGLAADVLESIEDVGEALARAEAGQAGDARTRARQAAITAIEAGACQGRAHAHCEVVELFQGAEARLYRYHRYDDVRLVFAPEFQIAFFGGDLDNYSYPRYCLDAAFLRLHEDGRPASTPTHLAWRTTAPRAGEPVFLAGHPAATSRQMTRAELEMQRDWFLPVRQLVRAELRGRLLQYSATGPAEARAATDALFDVENHYRWFQGRALALADPAFMQRLADGERALRARVAAAPGLRLRVGDPWSEAEEAMQRYRALFLRHEFLEARAGSISDLYRMAVRLVRAARERQRPDAERLPEYREARLEQLGRELLEPHAVAPGVERIGLELWLSKTQEFLGADDADVRRLLGADSPSGLAARLVGGTRLADPAERARLWNGGAAAIEASEDPLVRFVLGIDGRSRDVRSAYERAVAQPVADAGARIARARFEAYGDEAYPDATFTLRVSFGRVAGWEEGDRSIAPTTTLGGLRERATGAAPFVLPPRWQAALDRQDPGVVLDFVASVDTVNGNSGAPLLDAGGQLVGLAFDGNRASLAGEYGYEGVRGRGVAVSAVAIQRALVQVYGLDGLAAELGGARNVRPTR